ncbi:hypothetical protein N9U05_00180 [bacterium]|jgi:hypothetical protein|nr:hypothetical protein [bacterium]
MSGVSGMVHDIYDSAYSPTGSYNKLFRQALQQLSDANKNLLASGKSFYDATVLAGIKSEAVMSRICGAGFLNKNGTMKPILTLFARLGLDQLLFICEHHSKSLTQWLVQSLPALDPCGIVAQSTGVGGGGGWEDSVRGGDDGSTNGSSDPASSIGIPLKPGELTTACFR